MHRFIDSGKISDNDFTFDIKRAPFGRKLSYISIKDGTYPNEEGTERSQLGIFRLPRKYAAVERLQSQSFPCVMSIRPVYGDISIPYECTATLSMLEVRTEYGYVQFCFDSKDILRIRGSRIGLRFFSKLNAHDGFVSRLDGTHQVTYDMVGEFLFVPVNGELKIQGKWNEEKSCNEEVMLDISCGSDDIFELALHFSESDTERCPSYRSFDECVEEARKDYENWLAMYPEVPEKYEYVRKVAVYCIWTCCVGPMGLLKNNIISYEKTDSVFAWHSAYHAMTMTKDADISVRTMLSMFEYQDEFGQLPDMVDDRFINFLATKPPYHGVAVLYMLDRMGDRMTKEHCEALYTPLVKLHSWWTTFRDTDNDGVPQYNQGCEQSYDYSVMFSKGLPVESPDLIAYIVLLEEALAKLTERIGKTEESKEWLNRSKNLLDKLINEFWNGEKFIARMSSSHEIIEFDEIDAYSPIMLGRRLPAHITDKIAEALSDPEKFYTPIGFRSVKRKYFNGKPIPGIITGATQIKVVRGLCETGKKELVKDILTRFCDMTLEKLPMYRFLEFDPPEGFNGSILYYKEFGVCSAFSSVIFIILASLLKEISE